MNHSMLTRLVTPCVAAGAIIGSALIASAGEPCPGFVAGETRPETDPPAVQWEDGWLVPYEETIPGTDVTFRMVPVPGGTFQFGSPTDEEGRDGVEGPQCEVAVAPFWMSACEVTWSEYKAFMRMLELFTALESAGVKVVTEANEVDAVTAP